MQPGRKRLVLELPEDAYDMLAELQQQEGRYKTAIVAECIRRRYSAKVANAQPQEIQHERNTG